MSRARETSRLANNIVASSTNTGIVTSLPRFPLEVGVVGSATTSLYVNGSVSITGNIKNSNYVAFSVAMGI